MLSNSTWVERIARPAIVYIALLLAFRLSGKREIGQLSPFDFLIVVLIADAVQNGMVGDDTSVVGNLVPAMVLMGLSVTFDKIAFRSPKAAEIVEGKPTLLVYNGSLLRENCRKETISQEELLSALRQKGIARFQQVRFAILEADGKVSIIEQDIGKAETREDTISPEIYEQAVQAGLLKKEQAPLTGG